MNRKNSFAFLFSFLLSVFGSAFAVGDSTSTEPEGASTEEHLMAGRDYLVMGKAAPVGYARFTYLLLAQAADEEAGDLNRELLMGYLALEQTEVFEADMAERAIISAVYVPLREEPTDRYPDTEWLLEHYDFSRARVIQQQAGDLDPVVPYAVSSPTPLGEGGMVDADRLAVADLSEGAWSLLEFVGEEFALAAENGSGRGNARLTGRAFLLSGASEDAGYGLYSYLLFAQRPNAATLSLYGAVLDAYANVSDVSRFEEAGVDREELNVFYLPVRESAPDKPDVEWLLEHYDFVRAQIVLRVIEGGDRGGPYIVSYAQPLTSTTEINRERLLVQDLSGVPADLAFLWVKEFISQARQPQYWNNRALQRFMLSLRKGIAVAATAFVEVRSAHGDVSSFLEDKIKMPQ